MPCWPKRCKHLTASVPLPALANLCPAAAPSPAGGEGGDHHEGASPSCTFLLNSQSVEALAFRVDVRSRRDGALLARCYVEPATLQVRRGAAAAGASHALRLAAADLVPAPSPGAGH